MFSEMNETSTGTTTKQFLAGPFPSGMAVWVILMAVVALV